MENGKSFYRGFRSFSFCRAASSAAASRASFRCNLILEFLAIHPCTAMVESWTKNSRQRCFHRPFLNKESRLRGDGRNLSILPDLILEHIIVQLPLRFAGFISCAIDPLRKLFVGDTACIRLAGLRNLEWMRKELPHSGIVFQYDLLAA